jgi:parallel beta-helix repeat protein
MCPKSGSSASCAPASRVTARDHGLTFESTHRWAVPASVMLLVVAVLIAVLTSPAAALGGFCGGTTPCECGDLLLGSRTLVFSTDPITSGCCALNGLLIFAYGIDDPDIPSLTLDLGGNTICGMDDGFGIDINRSHNVTVVGGRIRNFGIGIQSNSYDVRISRVQVLDNVGTGIDFVLPLLSGNNVVIEACVVRGNGGGGIALGSGDDNTVRQCRSEYNGGVGIGLSGDGNTVENNVAHANGSDGIRILGDGNVVRLNRAEYGQAYGFVIHGNDNAVSRNYVLQNGAFPNEFDGFAIAGTGNTFDRNRSDSNLGHGIHDSGPGPNSYTGNRCTGNFLGPSSPQGLCK